MLHIVSLVTLLAAVGAIPLRPSSSRDLLQACIDDPRVETQIRADCTAWMDSKGCCKQCNKGKACGNTCIERKDVCHVGNGCACDANTTFQNGLPILPGVVGIQCPSKCLQSLVKAQASCLYAQNEQVKSFVDTYLPLATSESATSSPTFSPTVRGSFVPTFLPSAVPSLSPTEPPTKAKATPSPSATPSEQPTASPTVAPTQIPTVAPTSKPTATPTFTVTDPPIIPREPETIAPCSDFGAADVLLVLDSSGSIDANDWGVFMSFADKLIQQAPISESGLHLGLVQFATNATLRQPLTGSKELFTQTSKTRLPRGKTNMAKAIDVVMQEFRDNGRRGTNKIALIFSDGLPSDRKATDESMRRAKEQGIKVLMATIGFWASLLPPPPAWLSAPPFVAEDGFVELDARLGDVLALICDQSQQPPTVTPTELPSFSPSFERTTAPTVVPTYSPTFAPSATPTVEPSANPSHALTDPPTNLPTASPSAEPTANPTQDPTRQPTRDPTFFPTSAPTQRPTDVPTTQPPTTDKPSFAPSHTPTEEPSGLPTATPTAEPTVDPSPAPTDAPTLNPSRLPTGVPTAEPSTSSPTISPTVRPTIAPTVTPTANPSVTPSSTPSVIPTRQPTVVPSRDPTVTSTPSAIPSARPSVWPSAAPSLAPSAVPTASPVASCGKVDLVFVVDGSQSIDESQWADQRNFVRSLVNSVAVSPDLVNVGIVIFADRAKSVTELTSNKFTVLGSIDSGFDRSKPFLGLQTYVDTGVDVASSWLLQGRAGATKLIVVLTDGEPSNAAYAKASFERATGTGIIVMAVLVGTSAAPAVASWTSVPPIPIDSFAALNTAVSQVANKLCGSTLRPPAPFASDVAKIATCGAIADVSFVLEANADVDQWEWLQQGSFVKELINVLPVAADALNVGVISYAKTANVLNPLERSKAALLSKSWADRGILGAGWRIDTGVQAAQAQLQGGRANARKVVIVLAHHEPSDFGLADSTFGTLKDTGAEVLFVVVGHGAAALTKQDVLAWSTIPEVWARNGYDNLSSQGIAETLSAIAKAVCKSPSTPSATKPTAYPISAPTANPSSASSTKIPQGYDSCAREKAWCPTGTVNMGEAFRTVAGAWCCIPAKTPSRSPTLPAWLLTQQSD